MKERCYRFLGVGLIIVALMMLGCPLAWSGEKAGEATAKEGTVKILRQGAPEQENLEKGDRVDLEDAVSTGSASRVLLRFEDDSHSALARKSGIVPNDMGEADGATYFHAHVGSGEVRFIKELPETDPPSSYVITTPTAIISVVPTKRAADFAVRVVNEMQTVVTVIWGKVTVKNILEDIETVRKVRSCQRVHVRAGKKPSRVYGVSSKVMERIIDRTTIPGTLPDEVPNCQTKWGCPCPWGYAQDTDGKCKPCAFHAGAVYDPNTCKCTCLCPDGSIPDPFTGACFTSGECPAEMPVLVPGLPAPDPNFLPHEGCPYCVCCPEFEGCFASTPWDFSCAQPRCGRCGPIAGPWPGVIMPPDPFGFYPCAKCCECDVYFHLPGDPCGLNSAGFIPSWPCSVGGKCISMSDCIAQGGFFVRTDSRIPWRPCWVCQREAPHVMFAMKKGPQCPECQKLTFRKGKAECVPDPNKKDCFIKGKCGICRDGRCVEMPPCPEGQQRDSRCKCTVPEPPFKCESNADCAKATKGRKPCCKHGACTKLKRCPDGRLRCKCKQKPPVPGPDPGPPGVVPQDCGKCGRLVQGRCVYPRCPKNTRLNRRTCRCVPVVKPECKRNRDCGRCEKCRKGKCVRKDCPPGKRLDPRTCRCRPYPRPECRTHRDCGRCEKCRNGRCVKPSCPQGQRLDLKTCRCRPYQPPECQTDRQCGRCEKCRNGKCIKPSCPQGRRLDLKSCRCIPYPRPECRSHRECGRCEKCREGRCVKRSCPPGQKLNMRTCKCDRIVKPGCRSDRECGRCEKCREGRCVRRPCPPGHKLNMRTCKCDRIVKPGCRFDSECGRCEKCREGRCVRQPCPPGKRLDLKTCRCRGKDIGGCTSDAQCGVCGRCRNGACVRPGCRYGQRLDPNTCRCVSRPGQGGCRTNADCPPGTRCLRGKCVTRERYPERAPKPGPEMQTPRQPTRPQAMPTRPRERPTMPPPTVTPPLRMQPNRTVVPREQDPARGRKRERRQQVQPQVQ